MICSRCQGLMTVDSFIDMEEDTGQLWLSAWRCVNCGQVTDPGMIRNRRNQPIDDDRCRGRRRPRRSPRTLLPVRLIA